MDIILNKTKLYAGSKLRKDAFSIIESGYTAISINDLIKNRFSFIAKNIKLKNRYGKVTNKIDLRGYKSVYVIGIGKGSYSAVSSIVDIMGKSVSMAFALDIKDSPKPVKKIEKVKVLYGTHPEPSIKNVENTKKIIKFVEKLKKEDFVIYFIGGGGSSLFCGSKDEYKYSSEIFSKLTKVGAPIKDLNTVRKHLSVSKGGWLAKYTYPARYLSLIVSDVPKNELNIIASGPTVLDRTSVKDAVDVLRKYKIAYKNLHFTDTPKDKKYFYKSNNVLIASNIDALYAMRDNAIKLGYKVNIITTSYSGEAKNLLVSFVKKARHKKEVILAGGETTVTLHKNHGIGGRNQEASLGVINEAYNAKINLLDIFASSIASDGYDYVPVAGAIADVITMKSVIKKGIDPNKYLLNNDSYSFFKKVGGIIKVKRQAFNISDFMIVVRG